MKVLREEKVGGAMLRLVQGDITLRDVQAIVNAANEHLKHGGGVAGAIVRRGGQEIQDESDRIGFAPVGTAVITTGGALKAGHVIHAVGPRMGEGEEDEKLGSAVESTLRLAMGNGISTISMPAISSGIFGFPKDRCASILVAVSRQFLQDNPEALDLVEFCVHDDITAGHFMRELGGEGLVG